MRLGDLTIKVPIIQGGMGIKVSMANLASAVANEGGVGVISGTGITPDEIKKEIKKARLKLRGKGVLGVNIMVAATNFLEIVHAAIEENIDIIICGAGFSRDIFEIVKKSNTKLIPIVSSLKLAKIAEKLGADAIIVEGGNAGGHLGTEKNSWDIIEEIVKEIKIPIFGAGGIITPYDAEKMMKLGVNGIQMGSRFLASKECDINDRFKELYIKSQKDDIVQIMSSVGLPANAILTPFVKQLLEKKEMKVKECVNCLKKCNKIFCIREALIKSYEGNLNEGLFFAGKDIWKIKEILTVKEIFDIFEDKILLQIY